MTLASYTYVLSHWIFAMQYLRTSLVLPNHLSYIQINLMEEKYQHELNVISQQRFS